MSATGLSVSVLAYVPPSVLFRRRAAIIAGACLWASRAPRADVAAPVSGLPPAPVP